MSMELAPDTKRKIQQLLSEKPQRNPYKRFTILAYQLADVGRCMRYMNIYPKERSAYEKYLRTALSDLLIQTIIFSELFGHDLDELVHLGAQRLEEFKKKGDYSEAD